MTTISCVYSKLRVRCLAIFWIQLIVIIYGILAILIASKLNVFYQIFLTYAIVRLIINIMALSAIHKVSLFNINSIFKNIHFFLYFSEKTLSFVASNCCSNNGNGYFINYFHPTSMFIRPGTVRLRCGLLHYGYSRLRTSFNFAR